jgi:hypothetical protein
MTVENVSGFTPGRIMLEMAAASREQEMWERRYKALCQAYPIERIFADGDGHYGLRDFMDYAAEVCGFAATGEA